MANYKESRNTNNSNDNTRRKKQKKKETIQQQKMDEFRILTLKHEVLKISVCLQTTLAVETHLAGG
jgi:hypothetical protein